MSLKIISNAWKTMLRRGESVSEVVAAMAAVGMSR
ncbi:unnamed protein product, partial [marine sediment metagenome]